VRSVRFGLKPEAIPSLWASSDVILRVINKGEVQVRCRGAHRIRIQIVIKIKLERSSYYSNSNFSIERSLFFKSNDFFTKLDRIFLQPKNLNVWLVCQRQIFDNRCNGQTLRNLIYFILNSHTMYRTVTFSRITVQCHYIVICVYN
jgi:hypothetical protein